LSGSIPASIGNLVNLQILYLQNNAGLSGNLELACITPAPTVNITSTGLVLRPCLCVNSSPKCCSVVRSWKLMGKTTPSVDPTSATACCYTLGSTTQTSGIPGVTCTSDGTVTFIDWTNRGLTGSIPSEIGNLTSLICLNLNGNQLTGSIPPEVRNLVNLENLSLQGNRLNGTLPDWIGNMTRLTNLWLYVNQFSGPIPPWIGNLVNLNYLVLNGNQLSGSIPPEIGKLKNLQVLNLEHNQLNGSFPDCIGTLTNLRSISIGWNLFTGPIPPGIGSLVNLIFLSLDSNRLFGPIPSSIGKLTKLVDFGVNYNIGLNGTFTPNCNVRFYAVGTSVTACGCVSATSPPAVYPPPGTPGACLATGPATSLRKRILAFSQVIGTYNFTCHSDSNGNPFQDCLNTMGQICNSTYIAGNTIRINDCKTKVNTMIEQMNSHWQLVRKSCGQWSWNGITGSVGSTDCASANTALQQNAFYIISDGSRIKVPASLTDSINRGLWSNTVLKG